MKKRKQSSAPLRSSYPNDDGAPGGFRGMVEIDFATCSLEGACADACPTPALTLERGKDQKSATLRLDTGQCIFCGLCEEACPEGAISLSGQFELAARDRSDLVQIAFYGKDRKPRPEAKRHHEPDGEGGALRKRILDLLGRTMHIRHLDAGSCNGCETEILATSSAIYDLTRFGIDFVESPRHADILLITGPVTRAMREPLRRTFEAMPGPRIVVASGTCAIGGGIFYDAYAQCGGADGVVPVDVYLPGCPPRPEALIHGLLLALDRAEQKVVGRTLHRDLPSKPPDRKS